MRLQSDAVLQYALPERKSRVMYKDLKIESPYNLYLHDGLPPTPVANPGIKSLLARKLKNRLLIFCNRNRWRELL